MFAQPACATSLMLSSTRQQRRPVLGRTVSQRGLILPMPDAGARCAPDRSECEILPKYERECPGE